MRGHLQTHEIAWAILSIVGFAILCLAVAANLHWLASSLLLAIAGALAVGAAEWLMRRSWFTSAIFIIIALLIIVFVDAPMGDWGWGGGDSTDRTEDRRKEDRRHKLERAIAKREALLRSSGQAELAR